MLHTKFQGHRSIASAEEDFFKFFTIYGHGGHLGHVTRTIWTIFRSPDPWRLHMKLGYNRPSSFRGEVVWNCGRTTTDDGACLYYKLPRSLRLRWANKKPKNSVVTFIHYVFKKCNSFKLVIITFIRNYHPPTPGGYIWNLVTIGQVASEEKSFEIVDGRRRTTDDDGRRSLSIL